jgi:hypothetical protein
MTWGDQEFTDCKPNEANLRHLAARRRAEDDVDWEPDFTALVVLLCVLVLGAVGLFLWWLL